jgi:hypothetical protein
LWRLVREPIERLERRGWSLLLSAGASREPSLTTDSTLAFPCGTSSHPRFSVPCELPFHRRGWLRSLSADTCDIPLNGHPRPMPIHRSLSGSAVISLSCEWADGAARGVRGADLLLDVSVNRVERDADRVEEMVSGPPSALRFFLHFCRQNARHCPLSVRSSHRYATDASPSPSASRVSSGLSREPLKLISPALFPRLQDSGRCWFRSLRFPLGLFLPATAVGERVDREPMGR